MLILDLRLFFSYLRVHAPVVVPEADTRTPSPRAPAHVSELLTNPEAVVPLEWQVSNPPAPAIFSQAQVHMNGFMWVLRVQIQNLMLTQQAVCPLRQWNPPASVS